MAIDFGISDALEEIAARVHERRCILFLGSAVHAPPPAGSAHAYPAGERPALAGELTEALARHSRRSPDFGSRDEGNLQRVSLFYELGRSRSQLIDAVQEAVQDGKRPSPMVRALAQLDFPVVLTTNYDNLYEQALREQGKDPLVVVYTRKRRPRVTAADLRSPRPVVFKLHGDFSRRESLVITENDYIDFVGQMTEKDPYHPIPLPLKRLLMTWTTLFLGYSLADYNLRLVFHTLRWRMDEACYPPMYSVDRRPDVLTRDVWERRRGYLRFVVDDVWRFVPDLREQVLKKESGP
jgi:SIR2-like protein